ncbi:MAG TPA: cache domain-containing protein [Dehalococcoidia bacterium]|nr:cache domain-containing protein [Dehalococcoidia bacterium]
MHRTAAQPAAPGRRRVVAMRQSLLWRVMILVIIGTAAVLAAFGVSSLLAVSESRDRTLDERRALAQATAGHVDYVVRQGMEALDELSLAEGFDITDSNPQPEQQALRRAYLASLFSQGIFLLDSRGNVLAAEPAVPAETASLGVLPLLTQALTAGRPTVSGLSTGISDGKPVVSIAVPVRDKDGIVQGAVIGEIGLTGSELSEIIASSAPGKSGYAQIVDQRGTVLASTLAGEVLQENPHQSLVAGLVQEKSASSGTCHSCHQVAGASGDQTGQKEVMAFAPLQAAPWGVMIRQPESEALAPARRLEERAVWLGVPAFILALLFAWATVRSIVGPVRVLTTAAQRLASGDLSQPVPVIGNDEIGRLGRSFETMRVRLKDALERVEDWAHELEDHVRDRTRELEASRDNLRAAAEENATLYQEVKRKDEARGELLKKVITAQEEERRRIARELHDETSQNLSVLAMGLESAGPGGDRLSGLKDLAVKTLDGVHRLVYDLRPSVLDDLGLIAGLRWYAESRLQPLGVHVSLMVSGEERRLPAELETGLFRIGQEAITNIARHAKADNVFVSVNFQEDRVTMEVEDDGGGFDVEAGEARAEGRGWGLLGISERAALFGGSVEIASELGVGTRIEVSIPVGKGLDDGSPGQDSGTHSG